MPVARDAVSTSAIIMLRFIDEFLRLVYEYFIVFMTSCDGLSCVAFRFFIYLRQVIRTDSIGWLIIFTKTSHFVYNRSYRELRQQLSIKRRINAPNYD